MEMMQTTCSTTLSLRSGRPEGGRPRRGILGVKLRVSRRPGERLTPQQGRDYTEPPKENLCRAVGTRPVPRVPIRRGDFLWRGDLCGRPSLVPAARHRGSNGE